MKTWQNIVLLLICIALAACDTGSSGSTKDMSDDSNQQPADETDDSTQPPNTARYQVQFHANWSASTFPTNYPSGRNPHFTTLIGATHSSDVTLWEVDGIATPGVEEMAELGNTTTLRDEINNHASGIGSVVSDSVSGTSGIVSTISFSVSKSTPLLTLSTMIAPSSDWFTGVSRVSLLDEHGQWRSTFTVKLLAYDAGTEEDDIVFSLNNADISPKQPITLLSHEQTDFAMGKHRDNGLHIGEFVFTKSP